MTSWQPMETAPKDRRILLRTADFGAVEGWWSVEVQNFYKSEEAGDWVSDWRIGFAPDEPRLFCGCIPKAWAPLPIDEEEGDERWRSFLARPTSDEH